MQNVEHQTCRHVAKPYERLRMNSEGVQYYGAHRHVDKKFTDGQSQKIGKEEIFGHGAEFKID